SDPTRIAAAASTPTIGASAAAPSGTTPTTRISPYVPSLSSTPARITDPTVGASVWASGSQVCNGHSGLFTANASASSVNATIWVPREIPAPPFAVNITRSAVPAAATTVNTPTSSSTDPSRV